MQSVDVKKLYAHVNGVCLVCFMSLKIITDLMTNDKAVEKTKGNVLDRLDTHKRQFVEDYRELRGHISDTCRANNIVRQTYYNWLDADKDFALAIAEAEAELNDDMRKALIEKGADGDLGAIIFYLKNRHPDFKPQPSSALKFETGSDGAVTVQVINYAQDNTPS